VRINVGLLMGISIEADSLRRNIASFAASLNSMYSDSIEEIATTDSLPDSHTIPP